MIRTPELPNVSLLLRHGLVKVGDEVWTSSSSLQWGRAARRIVAEIDANGRIVPDECHAPLRKFWEEWNVVGSTESLGERWCRYAHWRFRTCVPEIVNTVFAYGHTTYYYEPDEGPEEDVASVRATLEDLALFRENVTIAISPDWWWRSDFNLM